MENSSGSDETLVLREIVKRRKLAAGSPHDDLLERLPVRVDHPVPAEEVVVDLRPDGGRERVAVVLLDLGANLPPPLCGTPEISEGQRVVRVFTADYPFRVFGSDAELFERLSAHSSAGRRIALFFHTTRNLGLRPSTKRRKEEHKWLSALFLEVGDSAEPNCFSAHGGLLNNRRRLSDFRERL